jgi:hypothetical protein
VRNRLSDDPIVTAQVDGRLGPIKGPFPALPHRIGLVELSAHQVRVNSAFLGQQGRSSFKDNSRGIHGVRFYVVNGHSA